MSDNEIVNIKQMSDEQIMQAIGQDDGSNAGNNIPRLAINRTPEDDDGNQLPVGHFFTYDSTLVKMYLVNHYIKTICKCNAIYALRCREG